MEEALNLSSDRIQNERMNLGAKGKKRRIHIVSKSQKYEHHINRLVSEKINFIYQRINLNAT